MKKIYYGAWNNFLEFDWPLRFFFEILVTLGLLFVLFRILKYIDGEWKIKKKLIMAIVLIVTEVIYFLGRKNNSAAVLDNAVIDWGKKHADGEKKLNSTLYGIGALLIAIVYIMAIFVDTPIADNIPQYYLKDIEQIKSACMQYENWLSKGCENYPPLFIKKEMPEVIETESEAESESVVKEDIYIQLNERGQNGSNIRKIPDLNGEVVGGVRGDADILYLNEWVHDGERYWVKVFLSKDDIEGWLSGKLVEPEQLEDIIEE